MIREKVSKIVGIDWLKINQDKLLGIFKDICQKTVNIYVEDILNQEKIIINEALDNLTSEYDFLNVRMVTKKEASDIILFYSRREPFIREREKIYINVGFLRTIEGKTPSKEIWIPKRILKNILLKRYYRVLGYSIFRALGLSNCPSRYCFLYKFKDVKELDEILHYHPGHLCWLHFVEVKGYNNDIPIL